MFNKYKTVLVSGPISSGKTTLLKRYIDSLKLHSSLTLFYLVTNNETIYKVLQKFYNGELDKITCNITKK